MSTTRLPLIAGNWKMHGNAAMVGEFIAAFENGLSDQFSSIEMVLLPPFVYLQQMSRLLGQSAIKLGAQNVSSEHSGALTGEVSAAMLTDFACQYVIVGHSERRALFAETDELVARKAVAALDAAISPIVCVGESGSAREAGQTQQVVKNQCDVVLAAVASHPFRQKLVIAYEPIWAIGTGKSATPQQAQEIHALLRDYVASVDNTLASHVRIIYGGSVKPDNAQALLTMPDIDGALVGGASLDANQLLQIAKHNFSASISSERN